MFMKNGDKEYRELAPGIELKTLTYGGATLLGEFRLKQGALVPAHSHVHEQIGYLVSGKIRFITDDATFEAEPGDSWCILPEQTHAAEVLEDCLLIEVFSPLREEYIS